MEGLYSLAVLVLLPGVLRAETCGPSPPPTLVTPLYTDLRLDGFQVSHLMGFTLERCVLECFLVKLCLSFNYREHLGVCALNNVTVSAVGEENLVNETGFVHHDLQSWSGLQTMAGTCASKPCAENQRCIQTYPTHTCADVDCGPPPKYILGQAPSQYFVTSAQTVTSLGSRAPYSCNDPWVWDGWENNYDAPFYNSSFKICNSDYTWSKNTPQCLDNKVRTCGDIRACNPAHGDGHYLVKYEDGKPGQKAIIYCHNMTGTIKTFLTLPQTYRNLANDGGDAQGAGRAYASYNKIRISNDFAVILDDLTFALKDNGGYPYASARACAGTDENSIVFRIHLAGTGLGIDPATTWTYATDVNTGTARVDAANRSDTHVNGRCYATNTCNNCYPIGQTIQLQWLSNPTEAVDGSEAKRPVCLTSFNFN